MGDQADGEDIGPAVDRIGRVAQFGRHIRIGAGRFEGLRGAVVSGKRLSQIAYGGAPVRSDQNILRFQVPVDDAAFMQDCDAREGVPQNRQGQIARQRVCGFPRQVGAPHPGRDGVDEIGHDEIGRLVLRHALVQYRYDGGVVECRQESRLPFEGAAPVRHGILLAAAERVALAPPGRPEEFERDRPAVASALVDDRDGTPAQTADDAVGTDGVHE